MKRNSKTILSLILSAAIALTLASCTVESDEDIKSITADNGNSSGDISDNTDSTQQTMSPEISEQICFEYEGLKATATKIEDDMIWGKGLKLSFENNSDKDLSVTTDAVIVNNCMVTDLFVADIAAGKKSNETLYLSSSDLEAAGIENIGQIEIYFRVYESDTFETVYKADCVTIKTSFFDTMDTSADNSGNTLYDADGIKIIGKYVDEDTFWGSSVLLLIENNSGKNITVSCDDMSINGYMISGFLYSTVYSGKYAIDSIEIFSSELEENSITSIEEIEVKFSIIDPETFSTITETDPISFSVS